MSERDECSGIRPHVAKSVLEGVHDRVLIHGRFVERAGLLGAISPWSRMVLGKLTDNSDISVSAE